MSLDLQVLVFGVPLAFAVLIMLWMEFLSRVSRWRDLESRREIFKMQRTRDRISAWRCSNTPMED